MKELDRVRQDIAFLRLGNATRKTCKRPGCRKKAVSSGLCKDHKQEPNFDALKQVERD